MTFGFGKFQRMIQLYQLKKFSKTQKQYGSQVRFPMTYLEPNEKIKYIR